MDESTPVFIEELSLTSFLSYHKISVPLSKLNVLIGANASGKSNFLEAFRLLQAAPRNFIVPIRVGGGVGQWINKYDGVDASAKIEAIVNFNPQSLRYAIQFSSIGQRLSVTDELIENEKPRYGHDDVYFFYRYQDGNPTLNVKLTKGDDSDSPREHRHLRREDISYEQSILSQRSDRDIYPEITYLGNHFANIAIFTDWDISRQSPIRQPQLIDAPNDFLLPDASNLALVINDLIYRGNRSQLLQDLQNFYDDVTDIVVKIEGGTAQLFVQERHKTMISTARLSDGTLRYLCLLAILRHPNPPSLICIEEPELGMHPDIMPTIADLLIQAAEYTQIIITTHSDALISALDDPETVLVCEQGEQGSSIQRLDQEKLDSWLKEYTIGDLWRMGEIGGNRW